MSIIRPQIQLIHSEASLPFYATEGSAAMDIRAVNIPPEGVVLTAMPENEWPSELFKLYTSGVEVRQTFVADTGWKCAVPEGYVMAIYSRSGHGFKYNVNLANGTGIIDSDYRGEVKIKLIAQRSDEFKWMHVLPHDSVAQLIILPYPKVEWNSVGVLNETSRGDGGFGSTTKR